MAKQNTKTKGIHGGAGRGQGMKPLYDEKMSSVQLKLPQGLYDFLIRHGEASPRLRILLEWGEAHPDQLMKDPGAPDINDLVRTSYSLTQRHVRIAEVLGYGKRTIGVRRVVHTAMSLGLDPDSMIADSEGA